MPKYTYECEYDIREGKTLKVEFVRPAKERDEPVPCNACGRPMKRMLSKTAPPTVKEKVDGYRNIHQRENNDQRVRDRAKKFFVQNEMPDQVAKEGIEEAKKKGWVKPDGKIIKVGDLK